MALTWIEFKGQRILYNDFRGMTEDAMIQQLDDEIAQLRKEPGKSRMLVDVTQARAGQRFMAAAKGKAKAIDALIDRQAIVGVDGLKGIQLKAYNSLGGGTLKPFDSETAAKEYLAS